MVELRVNVQPARNRLRQARLGISRSLNDALRTLESLAKRNARLVIGGRTGSRVASTVRRTADSVYTRDPIGIHKHLGGTIRARKGWLAIPLRKGWTGRGFWVKSKRGNVVLLDRTTKEPVIVLKKSVFQRARPWWPDASTAVRLLQANLARMVK